MATQIKGLGTRKKTAAMLTHATGTKKKKTLRKHFGQLKRGLSGLAYQKKVRDEWD